jgi:hypothetical protein
MNEIIVRIDRYFKYPDIMQQTSSSEGIWGNIKFTEEKIPVCDYLVILDYPGEDIIVNVNPDNIIHICLEPPNAMSGYRQYANKKVSQIINQIYTGRKSVQAHGALPWHINKSYDFLTRLNANDLIKYNKIGWITSNQRSTRGHIKRMQFLENIKDIDEVDIRGRGFKPITDKWELLSACKYGIAYENYNSPYYWTEKIVDCYLSYAMPVYIGSKSISNFFPPESYIQINPESDDIIDQIKEIIASAKWDKNMEAISYARNLILNKYQLFPFLSHLIENEQSKNGVLKKNIKTNVSIKGGDLYFDNYPLHYRLKKVFERLNRKLRNRL